MVVLSGCNGVGQLSERLSIGRGRVLVVQRIFDDQEEEALMVSCCN